MVGTGVILHNRNRGNDQMKIEKSHPQHPLLFFLELPESSDSFDPNVVAEFEASVRELATGRSWVIDAPQFIDETVEPENPLLDRPVRTVGGLIYLYSVYPPWDAAISKETDRAQLGDVEAVIEAMSKFSQRTRWSVGFAYNHEDIG